jgi:hypothetical protein
MTFTRRLLTACFTSLLFGLSLNIANCCILTRRPGGRQNHCGQSVCRPARSLFSWEPKASLQTTARPISYGQTPHFA